MSEVWTTPWGNVTVAMDEVVLGLTNATLRWAADAYSPGMTKDEYRRALIARGFDGFVADEVIRTKWSVFDR